MVRKKERSLRSDCQSVPSLRLQEFPNESLRSSPDAAANNELGFACQKTGKSMIGNTLTLMNRRAK